MSPSLPAWIDISPKFFSSGMISYMDDIIHVSIFFYISRKSNLFELLFDYLLLYFTECLKSIFYFKERPRMCYLTREYNVFAHHSGAARTQPIFFSKSRISVSPLHQVYTLFKMWIITSHFAIMLCWLSNSLVGKN